ncbi:MAG: hypothetical protein ACHQ51_01605 [Elusimicrobiota bacterium]
MRFSPFFVVSAVGSLACCAGGWKLIKAKERKEGEAVFISLLAPRALLYYLGWLLLAFGVFAAFILTPMAYIAG